jgi:hypothetical protein
MADFMLPSIEDSFLDIKNGNNEILGTVDIVDIITIASDSEEEAEKFNKDKWDVFKEKFESQTGIIIPNKAAAVGLFDKAYEMLIDIKKKSSQLPKQQDSTESLLKALQYDT